MAANVQVVFRGELVEGFQPEDVRRRISRALQLDEARVAQLFSGARTVLKRSVDEATGRLYVTKLAELGARVHLEPSDAPPTTAFPPLPELPPDDEPAPLPWGTPPPSRPAPLSPLTRPAPLAPTTVPGALDPRPAEPEIACPTCGERQSKRLLCRHCATNIPMALAAKEAAAAQAREARLDARGVRHRGADSLTASRDAPVLLGLGFDGRMARFAYWTAGCVDLIAIALALIAFAQKPTAGRAVFFGLVMLVLLFVTLRQTVLRLHDFNASGWWCLITFVPIVGLVAMFVIALCPGTADENDFGPPPRDWHWGVLAAALSVATLLLLFGWAKMVQLAEMAEGSLGGADTAERGTMQAPAALPPAVASREQQAAFEDYRAARPHRAFAVSPQGAWGWAGDRATPREAVEAAFLDCDARRPAYSPPCELVDVNGMRGPGQ